MKLGKEFAVAARMIEYVRRLEALITEAMQRMYASHVEKTQMRLAPIKLIRSRTELNRGWSTFGRI
jgi:hypothetical protein